MDRNVWRPGLYFRYKISSCSVFSSVVRPRGFTRGPHYFLGRVCLARHKAKTYDIRFIPFTTTPYKTQNNEYSLITAANNPHQPQIERRYVSTTVSVPQQHCGQLYRPPLVSLVPRLISSYRLIPGRTHYGRRWDDSSCMEDLFGERMQAAIEALHQNSKNSLSVFHVTWSWNPASPTHFQ